MAKSTLTELQKLDRSALHHVHMGKCEITAWGLDDIRIL